MLLWILGIIDILAAISIALPNALGFYLGIIELLKGGSSLLGGISEKGFVILGIIDVIAGLMLLTGLSLPFFWIIFMIKGAFTAVFSMGS
jgi:hypothetical protein